MRVVLRIAVVLLVVVTSSAASPPPRVTIKAKVSGQWLEGMPLSATKKEINLLGRDGRVHTFPPDDARDYSQAAPSFTSLSQPEMRGALQREFGQGYDVSGTGHYLVVHPAGQRDYWAERFEDLYRSFVHYFTARGWRPREPEFPLVAIVVRSLEEMQAYGAKEGFRLPGGVLGYYSPRSNRVILYDQGSGKATQKDWAENSATIIHEAAHQTAFNTGIHSRYSAPPRWVAEGLGTLFEARGVWDSTRYKDRDDRVNGGRRDQFKQIAVKMNGGLIREMIATDEFYQTNPNAAYAVGWALTFYLVETQPLKYCQYLGKTANRPAFVEYSREQRLADFTFAFGQDFSMLAARMVRFMGELP